MKKLTTLVTALTLSSLSFGAYAYNHNDDDFFKNERGAYSVKDKKCHGHFDRKSFYQSSPEQRQAKMEKRIERKVQRMAERLDLTEKQQHKLKKILKHKALKKMELRKETRQQVRELLTPQQREQMKKNYRT